MQKKTLAIPSVLLSLNSNNPPPKGLVCGKPNSGHAQACGPLMQGNGLVVLLVDSLFLLVLLDCNKRLNRSSKNDNKFVIILSYKA